MMTSKRAIRVLLVDDSTMVRDMIRAILESDPGIVVVGEASNGVEAIRKVASLKPDIVTMDIEMPVMGGLDAIEQIMSATPVPILAVTALHGVRTAFAAVSKGALDVIEKPDLSPEMVQTFINKIRYLAGIDITAHLQTIRGLRGTAGAKSEPVQKNVSRRAIVAIAASTGGPQVINTILSHLPSRFSVPIVITQHIAEGFTQGMADWLNGGTALTVRCAAHGDILVAGHVYINPAEHSMKVTEQGVILLGEREAHQIYKPCCNTLLSSVATAYRNRTIGLIMTGMGDDGVEGMQAIKTAGGVTLAQDANSSVIFGMNRVAIDRGIIDRIVPLADIPGALLQLTGIGL
ncbi:MAG: chemotaxis-specific protein-glutamate methyltransferase CheB [Desulfuromonadaceae bacterium]|nr:chemotaxis-specific protein-glutamate methyltransferase CheB [Desulfuromonadaceae bacterium]MDD5105719.1 chemotaxis-specific protein-glutamate methyltransferase CheB [Desulfuromonadaceae bacterium]